MNFRISPFHKEPLKAPLFPFWVRYLFTNESHHDFRNKVSIMVFNATFNNI